MFAFVHFTNSAITAASYLGCLADFEVLLQGQQFFFLSPLSPLLSLFTSATAFRRRQLHAGGEACGVGFRQPCDDLSPCVMLPFNRLILVRSCCKIVPERK